MPISAYGLGIVLGFQVQINKINFDREYLRNGSTYRKSEKYLINYIFSTIRGIKIGELWPTNHKVIDAHVEPPNWTFFGRL